MGSLTQQDLLTIAYNFYSIAETGTGPGPYLLNIPVVTSNNAFRNSGVTLGVNANDFSQNKALAPSLVNAVNAYVLANPGLGLPLLTTADTQALQLALGGPGLPYYNPSLANYANNPSISAFLQSPGGMTYTDQLSGTYVGSSVLKIISGLSGTPFGEAILSDPANFALALQVLNNHGNLNALYNLAANGSAVFPDGSVVALSTGQSLGSVDLPGLAALLQHEYPGGLNINLQPGGNYVVDATLVANGFYANTLQVPPNTFTVAGLSQSAITLSKAPTVNTTAITEDNLVTVTKPDGSVVYTTTYNALTESRLQVNADGSYSVELQYTGPLPYDPTDLPDFTAPFNGATFGIDAVPGVGGYTEFFSPSESLVGVAQIASNDTSTQVTASDVAGNTIQLSVPFSNVSAVAFSEVIQGQPLITAVSLTQTGDQQTLQYFDSSGVGLSITLPNGVTGTLSQPSVGDVSLAIPGQQLSFGSSLPSYTIGVDPSSGMLMLTSSNGQVIYLTSADAASFNAAGSVGSYIGGQLAQLLVANSQLTSIGISTVFSAAGQVIGQEIAAGGINSANLSATQIGSDFAENAASALGGFAGGQIGAAIFRDIGIDPAVGSIIGGTVGTAVSLEAIQEVSDKLDLNLNVSQGFVNDLESGLPGAGIGVFEALTGLSPNVDAFGGSPQDEEIGSSIGGLIGTGLAAYFSLGLFSSIGTVIGQFVGSVIGSIFGETSVGPNAGGALSLDPNVQQDGTAFTSSIGYDNNPAQSIIDTISGLTQSVAALVNAEIDVIAGGAANVGNSVSVSAVNLVQVRLFVNPTTNQYDFYDGLALNTTNFPNATARDFGNSSDSYNNVLNDAVIRQLALTTISGGDPVLTSALAGSLIAYGMSFPGSPAAGGSYTDGSGAIDNDETIGELNYDIQAVSDYDLYIQNPVAFLVGFAARIASENASSAQQAAQDSVNYTPIDATSAWNEEMARGALLQRVWAFSSGEGPLMIDDYAPSNYGNEGLLVFSPDIVPDDITLGRNGNDLILSVAGVSGDSVTIEGAFAAPQNVLSEIEFESSAGGPPILFGQDLVEAFAAGFSGPLPVSQIEFISDATARMESHSGISTIIHADYANLTLTGDNNTIVLNGIYGYLSLTGSAVTAYTNGGGDIVVVPDSQNDDLTLNGAASQAYVNGNQTTLTLNGEDDIVQVYGDGNAITANGTGTTVTVEGNDDEVTANTAVIMVGDYTSALLVAGVANTITVGSQSNGILIQANQETVTLNGQESDDGQTGVSIDGENGVVVDVFGLEIDGDNTGFTDDGTNNVVLLTGQDITAAFDGTGGQGTIDVDTATVAVAGAGNTVTLNGINSVINVAGSSNNVATAGNTVNVADGTALLTLTGGGNTINLGSNLTNGTINSNGDTINLTGSNSVLAVGESAATVSITGSGNTFSLNGSQDVVSIAGSSNNVTDLSLHDRISVAGQDQILTTSGSTVSVATGARVTFNGILQSPYTDSNGNIVNLGADASIAITGGNNWVTTSGMDAVTVTGPGNGVGGSGTGNTVILATSGNTPDSEDYTQLNGSTITLDAGGEAALTGDNNQITVNGNATASILGSGNTVTGNGVTLTFGQPAGPPSGSTPFAVDGFAFPADQPGDYNNPAASSSLAALQATGANSVELVDTQFVANSSSSTIAPGAITASQSDLVAQIQQAEAEGLNVLLAPHLNISDGTWSALLNPTDVSAFFANYETFILYYANIAAETGVQTLSIGNELSTGYGPTSGLLTGSQYQSEWTNIINAVRQVYHGKLTYDSSAYETPTVSFWGQLDIIGANAYERTSSVTPPTEAELQAGWTQPIPTTINPIQSEGATKTQGFSYDGVPVSPITEYEDLSEQYSKPILLTEAGYASVNDTDLLEGDGSRNGATYIDYQQQTDAYQALLAALTQNNSVLPGQNNPWLTGVYLWYWNANPGEVTTDDSSVQGKPALNVVTSFYSPGTIVSPDFNTISGNGNTINVNSDSTIAVNGYLNNVQLSTGDDLTYTGGSSRIFSGADETITVGGTSEQSVGVLGSYDSNANYAADGKITGIYVLPNSQVGIFGNFNTVNSTAGDSIDFEGFGSLLGGGPNEAISVSQTYGQGDDLFVSGDNSDNGATAYNGQVAGISCYFDTQVVVFGASDDIGLLNGDSLWAEYGGGNVITGGEDEAVTLGGTAGNPDTACFNGDASNVLTSNNQTAGIYIDGGSQVDLIGSQNSIFLRDGGSGSAVSVNGTGNTYSLDSGYSSISISNLANGGSPANQLSFTSGASSEELWMTQSGNDLDVEVLGNPNFVDVKGWFASSSNQLQAILSSNGLTLDTGVTQLVQAMATYAGNNPSFNPGTTSVLPNDPTLQNAITSAWHH